MTPSLTGFVLWALLLAVLPVRSSRAQVQQVPRLLDRAVMITSPCGWRADPISGRMRRHRGIDIRARTGEALYAPVAGEVVQAGDRGEGMGLSVTLRHDDGSRSTYGHLSQVNVTAGTRVAAGCVLGAIGSTGHATGPHLHFEIEDARGNVLDPQGMLSLWQVGVAPLTDESLVARIVFPGEPKESGRNDYARIPGFARLASLGHGTFLPAGRRLVTASLLAHTPRIRLASTSHSR